MGTIFTILFTQPITNLLIGCFLLLQALAIPYALGFAIILLTVAIRFFLLPLTAAQIRASKKMQDLAPHLSALKEKHKDDKKKHQEEMMKLYKDHGVNPASGCLPVLLQIPIIWSLYHVLINAVNVTSVEKLQDINRLMYFEGMRIERLWDPTFFGLSLAASPSQVFSVNPLIILVPVITGVLQFVLSKMMMPEKPVEAKKDDFQSTFMRQSLFIFPIMIGVFSFTLPFGLSLYWNAFTIFGILQQYFLVGPGGLKQWEKYIRKNG